MSRADEDDMTRTAAALLALIPTAAQADEDPHLWLEEVEAEAARLRETYGAYLGSYRGDEGAAWKMVVANGELTIETAAQGSFALAEPDADGRFALPFPGMAVTFDMDAEGAVTVLVFHGPEGEQRMQRTED